MSLEKSKPIFLDVDSSIVENNLHFARDPNEEEFIKLFGNSAGNYPSKLVKPFPGVRGLLENRCHSLTIFAYFIKWKVRVYAQYYITIFTRIGKFVEVASGSLNFNFSTKN
ncbi:hypothetical protein NQ317_004319 [Molorchus minor]|uniref:Uncharacterized protein n=1 Tax=Molorchus minor TaxID=1323400 RepID=A0ABQ9JY44_9CUCU|nr:hypothetical protein NQ317_004319 [Molorchus minor]